QQGAVPADRQRADRGPEGGGVVQDQRPAAEVPGERRGVHVRQHQRPAPGLRDRAGRGDRGRDNQAVRRQARGGDGDAGGVGEVHPAAGDRRGGPDVVVGRGDRGGRAEVQQGGGGDRR